jgi:hypothetical protein
VGAALSMTWTTAPEREISDRCPAGMSVIRTGKDSGPGHFPSHDYGLNKAWLDASLTAYILLSWLQFLTLTATSPGRSRGHGQGRSPPTWQRVQTIPHPI